MPSRWDSNARTAEPGYWRTEAGRYSAPCRRSSRSPTATKLRSPRRWVRPPTRSRPQICRLPAPRCQRCERTKVAEPRCSSAGWSRQAGEPDRCRTVPHGRSMWSRHPPNCAAHWNCSSDTPSSPTPSTPLSSCSTLPKLLCHILVHSGWSPPTATSSAPAGAVAVPATGRRPSRCSRRSILPRPNSKAPSGAARNWWRHWPAP